MRLDMDIDIDVPDRSEILTILPHVPAAAYRENGKIEKHLVGVYFQNIPIDPETGFASIDYNDAEELGYMKFDFLNNTIYKGIRDPAHLDKLIKTEPLWDLLEDAIFVGQLHHIHNYPDLVANFKPRSVIELAALIALIRPGKKHLQKLPKDEIMKKIWLTDDDEGYTFKKSHAVAYGLSIAVQMNLIVEELSNALSND
jgi:DNA polymerase III alpha subunit